MKRAFSLIEIVVIVGIMLLISGISMASFVNVKNFQALDRDTDLVIETLRQARSQTMISLNSSSYGVHFDSKQFTLFKGTTYNQNDAYNKVFDLNGSDSITNISLNGGGNDVAFSRLSGETNQYGTVIVSSSSAGRSHTIIVHKTGLIEFQ